MTDPDRDLERELDAALDQLVAAARSRVTLPPASEVRMLANRRRRYRLAAFGTTTTLALGALCGGAYALSSTTFSTARGEDAGSTTGAPSSPVSGVHAPRVTASPSPTARAKAAPRTGVHQPEVTVPDIPDTEASGSSSAGGGGTIRIGPGSLLGVVDLPAPSSPALSWLRLPAIDRTASVCDLGALRLKAPAHSARAGFALEGRTTLVEELAEYRDATTARHTYEESVRRLQSCATTPLAVGDEGKVTGAASLDGVGEAAWTLQVSHRCPLAVCTPAATYSVSRASNLLVFVRQYATTATTTAGGATGPDSRSAAQTLARAVARVTGGEEVPTPR